MNSFVIRDFILRAFWVDGIFKIPGNCWEWLGMGCFCFYPGKEGIINESWIRGSFSV
jgi:hypothetical protein